MILQLLVQYSIDIDDGGNDAIGDGSDGDSIVDGADVAFDGDYELLLMVMMMLLMMVLMILLVMVVMMVLMVVMMMMLLMIIFVHFIHS